ncbi:MAG: molybdate ABC transporter permease subunit [Geobacteraceae bacterium]|nr:molybdate ABC transporter permease subunit [Geobacteraceae bacterium]
MQFAPTDIQAILLSARVGVVATLVALPLGFLAAWLLAFGRFKGKLLLELLFNLPLTLPPVVVGYLLLLLLGSQGALGRLLDLLGIKIIFTWKAAVIASVVVGFPLLVRSIRLAMEGIDLHLVQAARSLGAGPLDIILTVILPLSRRGIMAGSSLFFARSLGEFGATIIIAGNMPGVTQTLPLAIYDYASSPSGEGTALALCAVSILLSLAVLMLHETILQHKKGA